MDKTNLLTALRLTRPALGGELIKGLSSYHFKGNTVTAFNGMLLLRATLDFEFPITGSIEGETLFKLINGLDNEIELEAADDQLMVKSGRSKALFPIEDVDLTMLEDIEEGESHLYLPTHIMFAGGVKRCLNSVGGKGIPQEEIGIHVFVDGTECCMYSTNLTSYSRFKFPIADTKQKYQVFLPAAFAEQLLYLYNELTVPPSEIRVSSKYVRAEFANVSLRSSFYSNPVNLKLKKQVDEGIDELELVSIPEELTEAVKRSETVAGSDNTVQMRLDGDEGKLFLSTIGRKKQEFYDEVEIKEKFSGTSATLHLDVRSLKKMLPSCKEMAFGGDFLLMIGIEDYYDYVTMSRTD
jgi:DNA polymerase III sliding clamp (beta) subunit (PCNA family)